MFVFSRWNHKIACACFCLLYNPRHTLTSAPPIFLRGNKAQEFLRQFSLAWVYWLWHSNSIGWGPSIGFPKSEQRPRMSLEFQCTPLSPGKQWCECLSFFWNTALQPPPVAPPSTRFQLQSLKLAGGRELKQGPHCHPLLSPSGKISLSFIKQNPCSKFTQTDPLSILLPGEWTLRTEVILFTFPRHHWIPT